MTDILIVEDHEEIREMLRDFLKAEGYLVEAVARGSEGLDFLKKMQPKLVLLDIMLPDMEGFQICESIRQSPESNTAILILSARTEKEDKLRGLILGADDYIEKPYDIDILLAKIAGIFKRRYQSEVISEGNLRLDKEKHQVWKEKSEVFLTGKEYELLKLFMENKGRTLRKEFLFQKVWGMDSFSEAQTLTVHIKWIRQKIEEDPKNPLRLMTVWGVGYRFEG